MKRFSCFRLDPVNECVWRDGDDQSLPLTRKAFAVLSYLVAHGGRLVTKDELMEAVWPRTYVQEEILKTYVRKLRQALGDDAAGPSFIETRTGRGYRFIAAVTEDRSPRPGGVAVQPSTQLFGRDTELASLGAWYDRALTGERQVIFVTGEPGIGKTALIEAFVQQLAGTGVCVAKGQCIESHHQIEAYYPVLEAVDRLCRAPEIPHMVELLARHAPTWLAQFPARMPTTHRETLQREVLGATRERMLRELCGALEALTAKTPVVLVFEDLQYADLATLDIIAAFARRHEAARLLLLATYRPMEVRQADNPLRRLTQELRIQRHSHELPLASLSKTAVAEYLAARFSSAAFCAELADVIHQQTAGQPLFMVTVTEYLVAHGLLSNTREGTAWQLDAGWEAIHASVPRSLRQTIERQIAHLTTDEREVLQVASIDGVEFTARMVAAGLGRDVAAVEACCDSLAQRQWILREFGLHSFPDGSFSARYQFTHALYRDVLYSACNPAAKVRLHRRLGEELETACAGHPTDLAAELARHFQEGRDDARAVQYLCVAAATAAHRYAYPEAIAILETALPLVRNLADPARGEAEMAVLQQLAWVRDVSGERAAAAAIYGQVAERAAHLGDSETEARALINVGHQLRFFDLRRSLLVHERAAQIAARLGNPVLHAEAEANACFARLGLFGWRPEWFETIVRHVDWFLDTGERERFALNARNAVFARIICVDYAEAAHVSSRGKTIALEVGATASYFYCCAHAGWALTHLGQFGNALRELREALRLADQLGDVTFRSYVNLVLTDLHAEAFDFFTARTLSAEAIDAVRGTAFAHALQWALVSAATAEVGLGNHSRALGYTAELQTLYDRDEVPFAWYWQMPMRAARCEALLALDDVAAAQQEADRMRELSEDTAQRAWQARARQLCARVALAHDDHGGAEGEITAALGLTANLSAPLTAWRIDQTAAEVHAGRGRSVKAAHYWRRYTATLQGLADSLPTEEALRQSILTQLAYARLPRARA
ncbi:MAG: AAA family ATPase [Candidatus Binatia bacterium]